MPEVQILPRGALFLQGESMKDGEKIVQRLSECGKIMESGQFPKYDLDYIEKALRIMLAATEKTVLKNNKQMHRTSR